MFTTSHLEEYRANGFCLVHDCFSAEEIDTVREALPAIFAEDSPGRVLEKGSQSVRSVYGSHKTHEVFSLLVRHPRLVDAAQRILDSAVYVYQFKVNVKAAFSGDVWDWHQDYIFWREEDGTPDPRLTNVALFLDDVTEFNAPVFFIPGTHREDVIEAASQTSSVEAAVRAEYGPAPSWLSNLTADLKYSLPREVVATLARHRGLASAKGPAGSLLFFHPNLVHASSNNVSPFSRRVAFVTYNSVYNVPRAVAKPRPDFLASRDATPILAVGDDALSQVRLSGRGTGPAHARA
jgi:ectoine hydroxylase